MKAKKYSEIQIMSKLREADKFKAEGKSIAEIVKTLEITIPTYYKWRNEYGGKEKEIEKELKTLKKENELLKRLVAEKELDILMLKESYDGNKPAAL